MLLHWMICSYKNNIFFLVKEKCFHGEKYDLLSKQQVHSSTRLWTCLRLKVRYFEISCEKNLWNSSLRER